MASFVKRPCSGETEDDILEQQEEFLRTKFPPSAQVVRMTRPGDKRKSKSADVSSSADTITRGFLSFVSELCVSVSDHISVAWFLLSCSRHHLSNDDCLEDKREDHQNCSMLCCVHLNSDMHTHMNSS